MREYTVRLTITVDAESDDQMEDIVHDALHALECTGGVVYAVMVDAEKEQPDATA